MGHVSILLDKMGLDEMGINHNIIYPVADLHGFRGFHRTPLLKGCLQARILKVREKEVLLKVD